MDKNKIHIDEFVRNMLSDREEDKPAGAWTSMRTLLDQAMPVAGSVAGAAFNWRRFLGIASVVVVVSSLSFGGYKLLEDGQADGQDVVAEASASRALPAEQPRTTASPNGALPHETPNGSVNAEEPSGTNGRTVTATMPNENPTSDGASTFHETSASNGGTTPDAGNRSQAHATAATSRPNHGTSNPQRSSSTGPDASQQLPGTTASNASGNHNGSGQPRTTNSSRNASRVANSTINTGNGSDASRSIASNTTASGATNPVLNAGNTGSISTAPGPREANQRVARRDNRRSNNHSNVAVPNTGFQANGTNNSITASATRATRQRNGVQRPAIIPVAPRNRRQAAAFGGGAMDSITDYIVELRQYRDPLGRAWRLDTIGTYKRQRPVPRKAEEEEEADYVPQRKPNLPRRSYGPNPDAAAYQSAPGNTPAMGLAASKPAAGKKGNADDMYEKGGGMSLAATIDRTRSAISQIKWQPGLIGGFSAALGQHSFYGFQLGLSSLFLVNEKWSFGAEVKYNQRANGGATIKDDYLSTIEAGTNRWAEDTVSHFFNFSNMQAVELPVFIRREFGRFFAMAGINLTYAFRVNADEVEQRRGTTTIVTGYLPPNTNIGLQRSPSVQYTDFYQRFGMGYLLGAGYAITPALQADVRMTQMVWDNAATKGAQRVSKELYHLPTVQISINYRFNTARD